MCDYITCSHFSDDANDVAQRSGEYVEAMEKDELDIWDDITANDLQNLQDLILNPSPRPLNSPKSYNIKPPQQRWVNVPPQKPYIHTITPTPPQRRRVNNIFENDLAYSSSNDELSLSSDGEAQLPERKRKKRCRSSKYTREPLIGIVKEGIDRVRIKGHKLAVVAEELDCDISARTLRRYVILSQDITQPDSGFYFPLLAGEKPLKTGRVNRKRRRNSTEQSLADATLLQ